MNKIGLIIRREYLSRVKNKTFLLSTFLLPLVMVIFIVGAVYLSIQGSGKYKIAINDETNIFKDNLRNKNDNTVVFTYTTDTATNKLLTQSGFDAYIHIAKINQNEANSISLDVNKQISPIAEDYIRGEMNRILENKMLEDNFQIKTNVLDSLKANAQKIELKQSKGEGKEKQQLHSGLTSGIGFFCGILIYLTMFIYGAQVMRGVVEEKTNRIAEVMVSSVKPFQLMMGKIIGIGAVGLTQFLLWIILIGGITVAAQFFIPSDIMQQVQQLQSNPALRGSSTVQFSEAAQAIATTSNAISTLNWPLIIGSFLFFFLGGYLFYSALFAAVGSVINEDPQEAQSLMLPITMPIIFAFIIMTQAAQNPNSSLAFWGSIIPFTSPIVMMGIVPSPGVVPWWQLILSATLLVGGFLGTTWLAGKIYRTGILMYGKKSSWKEMFKWAFRRS